jgi:hypothetical protein
MVHQMMKVDLASPACPVAPPEGSPVWDTSGSLAAAGIDKNFVISATDILQTLLCLSYLTSKDADDSSKVRVYTSLADERVQALRELMRPMLWNSLPRARGL